MRFGDAAATCPGTAPAIITRRRTKTTRHQSPPARRPAIASPCRDG